jgi:hypothetical protein
VKLIIQTLVWFGAMGAVMFLAAGTQENHCMIAPAEARVASHSGKNRFHLFGR